MKKAFRNFVIFLALLILCTAIIAQLFKKESSSLIQGDCIVRSYDELFSALEEVPADILQAKYESHIPDMIQQDIELMLTFDQKLSILYTNDKNTSSIQIHKNSDAPSGLLVTLYGTYYESLRDLISFYRTEDSIVVYGTSLDSRHLQKCSMHFRDPLEDTLELLDCGSVDLFGVSRHIDDIYNTPGDSTLCRDGREFMLYHLGNQLGEISIFPGGEITTLSDTYLLDNQQNLYYLYYCANPEDPWIRFSLVDENVESVSPVYMQTNDNAFYFPYYKNGKKYVAMSSSLTEESFGQHYTSKHDKIAPSTLSFSISILEISKPLASLIVICKEPVSSTEFEWYVRYYYDIYRNSIYEKEHIGGLDTYLNERLSVKEINQFDRREVTLDQLPEVIEELQQLYLSHKI